MVNQPKVPKSSFPTAISVSYYPGKSQLVDLNRKNLWNVFTNEIKPLIYEYRRQMDSGLFVVDFENILAKITNLLQKDREFSTQFVFSPKAINELANSFVKSINAFSKDTFKGQMQKVLGIDPIGRETWLESFMGSAVSENVSWIKSIDKDYHDKIQTIVLQGVRRGQSINEMAEAISKASGASKTRAKFIARDQSGSILGDLTRTRHLNAGMKKFVWRDSDDERVRDSHADLDGNVFTWKDGATVKGREEVSQLMQRQKNLKTEKVNDEDNRVRRKG
ncbi:phage head morphogenesis protein [Salimicrobium flavidum]|uniref:Phage putative head morphogenesis protein, SPP1 gp7 family n=1 Tax=Salimicrobium flavidum TaxID=570947 RepID=A0A1N7KD91_9BACI|nr:minor capsid protein [Salimicrobium flavidum]SIS59522.1 phage putative head morphogenesis protein, SPP1 gp7 family [Salimicrobium flavidum]